MRVRAPEKGEGRETGERQVVDVLSASGDEPRILDPLERLADVRGRSVAGLMAASS